jgi:hypothetical protein
MPQGRVKSLRGWQQLKRSTKWHGGAPILQDAWLYGDFRFLANTDLEDQVLQGSYVYPKNMDTHTKLLLQEAQHIFHRLLKEEVMDFVLTTDFQSYW